MISHQLKCIFIHISKCAGTSVEKSLGLKNKKLNYNILYGWCPKTRLYLQHATPNQLIEFGYIDYKTWNEYYKFIIVRNPWDRAYSDYLWAINNEKLYDSFSNFLFRKGRFKKSLSRNEDFNISDHLNKQSEYFKLDGIEIQYDRVLRFENIKEELIELAKDLNLTPEQFKNTENVNKKKFKHYSLFYTPTRKRLVDTVYKSDIDLLDYQFENKKEPLDHIKSRLLWFFHPNGKKVLSLKYPKLSSFYRSIKKKIVK